MNDEAIRAEAQGFVDELLRIVHNTTLKESTELRMEKVASIRDLMILNLFDGKRMALESKSNQVNRRTLDIVHREKVIRAIADMMSMEDEEPIRFMIKESNNTHHIEFSKQLSTVVNQAKLCLKGKEEIPKKRV